MITQKSELQVERAMQERYGSDQSYGRSSGDKEECVDLRIFFFFLDLRIIKEVE